MNKSQTNETKTSSKEQKDKTTFFSLEEEEERKKIQEAASKFQTFQTFRSWREKLKLKIKKLDSDTIEKENNLSC